MKALDAIVIPTGNESEDLARAKVALNYGSYNSHYLISGMGPDMNIALEKEGKGEDTQGLNFHKKLFDYLREKYEEGEIGFFGVDINSLNSKENLLEVFPKEVSGRYALVSYPLHLLRFRFLEKRLKSKGLISNDVEIQYVSTKQSFRQFLYGLLALTKELVKS